MNFYANLDYSVGAYSHLSDLESIYMARDASCYTCTSWFQRAVHVISDFFFQTKIKRIASVFERVVQDYYIQKSNPITIFFADDEVEALHNQKERVDFVVSLIVANQASFDRCFGRLPIYQVYLTYMQKEYESPVEPVVKLYDWLDEYRDRQLMEANNQILELQLSDSIAALHANDQMLRNLRETTSSREAHLQGQINFLSEELERTRRQSRDNADSFALHEHEVESLNEQLILLARENRQIGDKNVIAEAREIELLLERQQNQNKIQAHEYMIETMKQGMFRQKDENDRLKRELELGEELHQQQLTRLTAAAQLQLSAAEEQHQMLQQILTALTPPVKSH